MFPETSFARMNDTDLQTAVEEATLDFTLGDNDAALKKLSSAVQHRPDSFAAWHALAEVHFSMKNLDEALSAANRALGIDSEDVHINTSLSRIWMERGDKERAEEYGAKARMMNWKEELRDNPSGSESLREDANGASI
jgi:tetratricopeptide (TPR) repeat protein